MNVDKFLERVEGVSLYEQIPLDGRIVGMAEKLFAFQLWLRENGHENALSLGKARDALFGVYRIGSDPDREDLTDIAKKQVREFEASVKKILPEFREHGI